MASESRWKLTPNRLEGKYAQLQIDFSCCGRQPVTPSKQTETTYLLNLLIVIQKKTIGLLTFFKKTLSIAHWIRAHYSLASIGGKINAWESQEAVRQLAVNYSFSS